MAYSRWRRKCVFNHRCIHEGRDQIGISELFLEMGDKNNGLKVKEQICDSSNLDRDGWVRA